MSIDLQIVDENNQPISGIPVADRIEYNGNNYLQYLVVLRTNYYFPEILEHSMLAFSHQTRITVS